MNFLEEASKEQKSYALPDGEHVMQLQSAEVKVTQKGDEYIGLVFNLQDGTKHFHNLFFHSEGAIRMAAPQLKKAMLIEKLPIYANLNDMLADQKNFINKVESAFNSLLKKKFTVKAETYFSKKKNEEVQNVMISGYVDTPNLAVQNAPTEAPKSSVDTNEKLPF